MTTGRHRTRPVVIELPPALCYPGVAGNLLTFGLLLPLCTFQHDGHHLLLNPRKRQFITHCGEQVALCEIYDPAAWAAILNEIPANHVREQDLAILGISLHHYPCLFGLKKETRIYRVLASKALLGILVRRSEEHTSE